MIDDESQFQPPAGSVQTPKRVRGASKPTEAKRQRRTSSQSKLALALVETHLAGVYSQMELLNKAIAELKESLS